MLNCGICKGEVRPFGRTNDIHTGFPVCNGPVCQFCYENKVRPALAKAKVGERTTQDTPKGYWLYISDTGEDYMTRDPKDLMFNMLRLGCKKLREICDREMVGCIIPDHCDTPEEAQEAIWAMFVEKTDIFITPEEDFFDSFYIR